jgi:1,3-beta-glucanosyltransferase GAS5
LQVEALYSKRFREQFAGGFVFEYSTEKKLAQETSPYPFNTFGPDNFGVGYFQPEDCDDVTTPCEYVPFPQFDTLAEKYEAVDTSDEANSVFYRRGWLNPDPPACPDKFPPLNTFVWPSDSVGSETCPVETPVFCPGVPVSCNVVTLPPVPVSSAESSFLFTSAAAAIAGLVVCLVF